MTRKMAYIGTSYFIGLFFASFISQKHALLIGIISAAFGFFSLVIKSDFKHKLSLCSFVFSIAMLWYAVYGLLFYNYIVSIDGDDFELTGIVLESSDYSGDNSSYIVYTNVKGRYTKIVLFDETKYSVGDKIYMKGTARIPENTYIFPKKDYYMTNGIFLFMNAETVKRIAHYNTPSYIANKYRNYIFSRIDSLLSGDEGELVKALVFGEKSGLDNEVLNTFSRSGIRHIISVSGFHLSFVCGIIFFILKKIKVGKSVRFFISELFIIAFAALAGFSFSVVRSGIMITILLFGNLIKRRPDIYSSLGTAFIVLTITMPYAVRNASLLLSVIGVWGIGIVAPYFVKDKNFGKYLDNPIKTMIYAGICTLVTFPFVLLSFKDVSLISPVGNLIIVPLCSIVLILGIIVIFTAWLPVISSPIIIICGMICRFTLFLTEKLSHLSFSSVSIRFENLIIIAFILFTAVSLSYLIFINKKFTAVTIVFSIFLMVFSYLINNIMMKDCMTITVFGDKYSSVIIQKSDNVVVIGNNGRKQADAVYKYLSNSGLMSIDVLILTSDPQYYSASYDSVLYNINCEKVYISDGSGFPENTRVMDCYPIVYGENEINIEYNDYTINVKNDNIYINYNEFSFLYAVNSSFEDENYSAVAFKKQPLSVRSGYMLDCSDDIRYTVICDGEKVRVVNL